MCCGAAGLLLLLVSNTEMKKHQMMGIQVTDLSNGEDPSRCLRTLLPYLGQFSENLHENEQYRTKEDTNPISVADPGFPRWGRNTNS